MIPRNFNLPPGVTEDDIDPPEDDEEDRRLDAADHENDIERNDV